MTKLFFHARSLLPLLCSSSPNPNHNTHLAMLGWILGSNNTTSPPVQSQSEGDTGDVRSAHMNDNNDTKTPANSAPEIYKKQRKPAVIVSFVDPDATQVPILFTMEKVKTFKRALPVDFGTSFVGRPYVSL